MRIIYTLCALLCFQFLNIHSADAQVQAYNTPCYADQNIHADVTSGPQTVIGDFDNDLSEPWYTNQAGGLQNFGGVCPDPDSTMFAKVTVDPLASSLTLTHLSGTAIDLQVYLVSIIEPCTPDSLDPAFGTYQEVDLGLFECSLEAVGSVEFDLCGLSTTEKQNLFVLVSVNNASGPTFGDFEIQLEQTEAPMNDECTDAISMGGGAGILNIGAAGRLCETGTTVDACPETGFTGTCYVNFNSGGTVWYTFTTGANVEHMFVEVTPGTADDITYALIELPSGCGAARAPVVNNVIDGEYCDGLITATDELSQLPVRANTTYYLMVNTPEATAGDFDICVEAYSPPTNDLVCNAEVVTFPAPGSNVSATNTSTVDASIFWTDPTNKGWVNFGCPAPATNADPYSAVFYKLDIDPFASRIQISADGFTGSGTLSGEIFLFDDETECPAYPHTVTSLTTAYPMAGDCDMETNTLQLDLCGFTAGDYDDLYLYVSSERLNQGTFNLNFWQEVSPQNDSCQISGNRGAEPIGDGNTLPAAPPTLMTGDLLCETAGSSPLTATTRGACPDPVAANTCFTDFNSEATVWYSFQTASDVELITARVQHSNSTSTRLAVFELPTGCGNAIEGSYPPAMLSEYCGDDPNGFVELENLPVRPNTTYYIAVSTDTMNWGPITEVCVEACQPPANDFPCNATVVSMENPTNVNNPYVISDANYSGESTTECANPYYTDNELNVINVGYNCDNNYSTVFYKLNVDDYATKLRVVGTAITPGIMLTGQLVNINDPCAVRPTDFGTTFFNQPMENPGECDLLSNDITLDLCGFTAGQKDSLYLIVSTERLNQGEFEIEIFQEVAPTNDECEDPSDPSRGAHSVGDGIVDVGDLECLIGSETNRGACPYNLTGPPCFMAFSNEPTVWYTFTTGPEVELITVNVEHSNGSEVRLALIDLGAPGCSFTTSEAINAPDYPDAYCVSNTSNGADSIFKLLVQENRTYHLLVSTPQASWGDINQICVENCPPPINDRLCDVEADPSLHVEPGEELATDRNAIPVNGTTVCANNFFQDFDLNFEDFGCTADEIESMVFYKINLDENATRLKVNRTAPFTDPLAIGLFKYNSSTCGTGVRDFFPQAWEDDNGPFVVCNAQSADSLIVNLCDYTEAQKDSFYLFVGSPRKMQSEFNIELSQQVAPPNDKCENAHEIIVAPDGVQRCFSGTPSIPQTTLFACEDPVDVDPSTVGGTTGRDPNCFINNPSNMGMTDYNGVWYRFENSGENLLDITVSHSQGEEINMALYAAANQTNPNCTQMLARLCLPDTGAMPGEVSYENYGLDPDTTYYLLVYTPKDVANDFDVCYEVIPVPPCDGNPPQYYNHTTPICGVQALDLFCIDMVSGANYNWYNQAWPGCGSGALHNPNWFSFIAGADNLRIQININDCQTGNGVQVAMYELPCEQEFDPNSPPENPSQLADNIVSNCQYVIPCSGSNSQIIFDNPTVEGQLYGIVFDGCSEDICNIEISVLEGADPPELDGSTLGDISFPDDQLGFNQDTVCQGALDVPFAISGEVEGACRYLWTLDGDTIPGATNTTMENIDFDVPPGIHQVCIEASNYCDTTDPLCIDVLVLPLEEHLTQDTICEGETYNWIGPYGNQLGSVPYGPYTGLTSDQLITDADVTFNQWMCDVDARLELFVRNENDENPTIIDTFACFGDAFSIYDVPVVGPQDGLPIQTTIEETGCDTFFELDLVVFGGLFYINSACDGNGNVEFFMTRNDAPQNTPWAEQDMIFQTDPDFSIEYEWTIAGRADSLGDTTTLVLSQQQIEDLAIRDELPLDLEITISYKGVPFCIIRASDYIDFSYNLSDNFPSITAILGDTTYCPGQSELEFSAEIQNPPDPSPSGNAPPDTVGDYKWYPPAGFTFQPPTSDTTDSIILTSPMNPTDSILCLVVTTERCRFIDSACIELETDLPDQPDFEPYRETCESSWTFAPNFASSGGWSIVDTPPTGNTATFSSTSSPNATVSVTEPGIYKFEWREGPPDCALYDTIEVNFLESPQSLPVVDTCYFGINFVATVDFEGGTPDYMIDSSITDISGSFDPTTGVFVSDTIEIIFTGPGANYGDVLRIAIMDSKGCVSDTVEIVLVCQCDSEIGDMATDTIEVCEDEVATATYLGGHTNDGDDTLNYILHSGDTNELVNVLDTSLNGEFTFDPTTMTLGDTYYISMVIGNAVGQYVDLNDPCLDVAIGQPVIWYENPVADAGVDTTVCGFEYILNANPSVGSGTWEVVPANPDVTIADPNSPSTTVTVSDPGSYTFRWTENNQGCIDSDEVNVELTGEIDWLIFTPCNATNDSFSIEIILSGGGGDYILVDGPGVLVGDTIKVASLPKDTFVTFVVDNQLGCGPDTIPDVGTTCICETEVGTLQTDTVLQACEDGCIDATVLNYDTTGQFLDPNDVASYVLHTSPGDTLLEPNFIAQSPSGEFCYSDFSGLVPLGDTVYVSVIIGNRATGDNVNWRNDPCFEITFGAKVVFDERPIADAGSDTSFCGLSGSLSANPSLGNGNWTLLDGPSNNVTISSPGNATTTVDVDTFGTFSFEWTEDNQGCTSSDTVELTFLSSPEAINVTPECDDIASSYTITFDIVGGDPSTYGVTGTVNGTLSGSTFTSEAIPHDSSYTFFVFDGNGCDTFEVTGTNFCPCITEIGSLNGAPLDLCRDERISGVSYDPSGETRDANDDLIYVLVDAAGNIIAERNNNPNFGFDPTTMTLGTTYNIRVYLGSVIGGDFQYDERCTVSDGDIEVTWYDFVEAMAEPAFDTLTCDLTSVDIDGSTSVGVGNGLTYSWTASNGGTIQGPADGSSITATSPGDYTLTVTDPVSGCTDEVTVTIERSADIPVAEAEALEPSVLTCDVDEVTIDGSGSSSGSNIVYGWTGPGIVGPTDQNTIVVDEAGTYTLTVTDMSNNCSSSTSVEILVDREAPVAQASVSDELSCSVTEVDLDGTGSSSGPEFEYLWTVSSADGNITGSTTSLITTSDSVGDYTLIVTNTDNGCVDSTTVSVTRNPNALTDIDVEANDPRCHNEVNGNISVTPTGGEQPITYTLTGDANEQNNTGTFANLGPGTYTIEVTDVNGCFETQTVTLVNPPLLSIDLTESIIIEEGDSAIVEAILPPGAIYDTLIWDTDTVPYTCLDSACTIIELSPFNTVEVMATVIGGVGCSDEDAMRIVVRVVRDVYIPNVFTPNGDGLNDVFLPAAGRRVVSINNMQIFDRWGSLIFESRNFQPGEEEFGWDGTFKGEELQPSVFVYKVEVEYDNGDIDILNGTVTLTR